MADPSGWLTIPEWYELAKSHGATARYRIRRYCEGEWASKWCDGVQVVYPPGVECQVVNEDMKFVPQLKGGKGSGLTVEIWYDYDTTSYSVLIHDADMSILGLEEPDSEDDEEEVKEKDEGEEEGEEDGEDEEQEVQEEEDGEEGTESSVKDKVEESAQDEDKLITTRSVLPIRMK